MNDQKCVCPKCGEVFSAPGASAAAVTPTPSAMNSAAPSPNMEASVAEPRKWYEFWKGGRRGPRRSTQRRRRTQRRRSTHRSRRH